GLRDDESRVVRHHHRRPMRALFVFLAACSGDAFTTWTQVDGVTGTPRSMSINPNNHVAPYVLYVAPDAGIHTSSDGATWTVGGPTNVSALSSMPMSRVSFVGLDDGSVVLT